VDLRQLEDEQIENGEKRQELRINEENIQHLITLSTTKAGLKPEDVHEKLNKEEDRTDMLKMRPIYILNSLSQKRDDYLKPIVIQRWKKWVRLRKLFKHCLHNCNVHLQAQENG